MMGSGMQRTKTSMAAAAAVATVLWVGVVVIAPPAGADGPPTYYVDGSSPGCTNTGGGSSQAPFCTISAAASVAGPGSSVVVASGTYAGNVTPLSSGTPGAPITYTTAPGASVQVVGGTHGFAISGRSWITVSGFQVSGTSGYGIYVNASSNIVVQGNQVTGSGQPRAGWVAAGIKLNGATDSVVSDNTSYRNTDGGIFLAGGATRDLVIGNRTYGNARQYTRAAPGIDVRSPGNTITGNITYQNEDSGIQLYNGANGSVVTDNVSYGNGDHGIDCLNSTGVVEVSNTVYDNRTAGINVEGAVGTAASSGATLRNNISVDNALSSTTTKGDIRVDAPSLPGTTVDSDLLWLSTSGTVATWGNAKYSSLSAFQAASGQESHGLSADPRWRDAADADFHLTAGSPAIDSADSGAPDEPSTDIEGGARVDDPATPNTGLGPVPYDDRGAYEYQPPDPYAALTVTPASGPAPLTVTADASRSASPEGITSFAFDFGDGTTTGPSGAATATHQYTSAGTYRVAVVVTNGTGATAAASAQVTVVSSVPPVAALTVTPATGAAPLPVTADASGSTDGGGTPIASYRFDFGDGTTSGPQSSAVADHTYQVPGTYTVTMTVTNTAGSSDTATAAVSVAPAPPVNLVGNPGFETGLTGWNNNGRAGITLTQTAGGHSGGYAVVLANSTSSTAPDCTLNDSPNWVAKTVSGTYQASLWVRATTPGATLKLRIREYNAGVFAGQAIASIVLSTTWQQVGLSYVPAAAGTSTLDYTAYVSPAPPGECFWADDAAITVG
jgi:parallel beta-helix repeat protein